MPNKVFYLLWIYSFQVLVNTILVLGYRTKRTEAISLFFCVCGFTWFYCVLFPPSVCILSNVTFWYESYFITLICIINWFFFFSTQLARVSETQRANQTSCLAIEWGGAIGFLVAALHIFGIIQNFRTWHFD